MISCRRRRRRSARISPSPATPCGRFPPELALFKSDTQQGVVKLALTVFDAKSGKLVQPGDPVYGFAYRTDWTALFFISWESNDLVPEPEKEQWIGRGR